MKDIKRCYICKKQSRLRKNEGACSQCLNYLSSYRGKVRAAIYSSLKYGIKSYIWNYLPYSLDDLKNHIEKQFEPWMNWSNWGKYNSKVWDDKKPSTWTWQIDHIVPQYNFIFRTLKDENFLECWSLSNLRPLASKKNALKHVKEDIVK